MARKIFLSFLGTGNYKPCKYVSSSLGESEVVEYVQGAIFNLACADFTKEDFVYIFLTKDAEKRHWPKLKSILSKGNASILPINEIPEGYSEVDIWKIFEAVFKVLKENDEIILDVTHGFRTLPMLAMVLINYAKALKNIKVKGIYYGAFEVLGPAYQIEEQIPNPENRKVPLLDLMAFSSLQDWTFAAQSFIKTGNPNSIVNLTNLSIKPILVETGGKDYPAGKLRELITSLKKGEREIATNRGKLIQNSTNILIAKNSINDLLQNPDSVLAPLRPLLEIIYNKIEKFGSATYANWEASVDWCITHGLEQQGITQLQEGIISFICNYNGLNDANLTDREIVSQAINIYAFNIKEDDWKAPACSNMETVREIIKSDFVVSNKKSYNRLTELRNDINHGGYKNNSLSDSSIFSARLNEAFLDFKSKTNGTAMANNNLNYQPMLLNLSNHPSTNWPENQLELAKNLYHTVIDIPFPAVHPNLNPDELEMLVDEYEKKVRHANPVAVHIMGEHTFAYRLVNRLKAIGIQCVASTTVRKVTIEDDLKTSQFQFVQFRPY